VRDSLWTQLVLKPQTTKGWEQSSITQERVNNLLQANDVCPTVMCALIIPNHT
jgi:hypothetical protein